MSYRERMEAWLQSEKVTAEEKDEIRKASEEVKQEMFSSPLHFGTAGMRALLGPGCARLNHLTVRRATIGVGKYLLEAFGDDAKKRGAAISFDNRICSKEFRDIACEVLNDLGIPVYTFQEPHPTPELSYTIRHLNCVGGVMITASHNNKEYNGYKFYDEKGCQGVYAPIERLVKIISALDDELTVEYEKVAPEERGKTTYLDLDDKYDQEFTDKELTTSLYKDHFTGERLTKIVFTPQCGCDCIVGPMLLRKAGYTVETVPGQDFFDPYFRGTPNPNPETDEAYQAAYQHLNKLNSEGANFNLILCTDPDADRCGLAFLNKEGKIQRFTGNQTGALLIDYLLSTLKKRNALPAKGTICNTFVTSSQGAKIAESYGVKVRTTATGFKYIGDMADRMREEGETFLMGYEESYGYLFADFIRDKDSLQSILNIADMVEYHLRMGKTLDVAYEELEKRVGHYHNSQVSFGFTGANSLERMAAELEKIRSNPFSELGGVKVKTLSDYLLRKITDFSASKRLDMDKPDIDTTDCLRFDFVDSSFIAIRPSGTEPKVKVYIEISQKSEEECLSQKAKMVNDLRQKLGL